ncbi:hypothetical protein B7486_66665, partial [cyanobacterium TDX16]
KGVDDVDAVAALDDLLTPRRRRRGERWRRAGRRRGRCRQFRPALGFCPWFAFLRRAFVLRLSVFFDIGGAGYRGPAEAPKDG